MKHNTQEWRNFYTDTVDMEVWRNEWHTLLEKSQDILCFSQSSKDILLKAYPTIDTKRIQVIPHKVKPLKPIKQHLFKSTHITIGILGIINYTKGAKIIRELLEIIQKRNLNISIVIIGDITERINAKQLIVTGKYKREELSSLIIEHKVNICLIPSIVPETFSYTTQEVMMMNLPLMVFNLGGPAERVREYEKGYIIEEMSADSVLITMDKMINVKKKYCKGNITLGILGAINYAKGLSILKDLLILSEREESFNLKIVVVGELSEPLMHKNLDITGKYNRDDLHQIIDKNKIDIFLIPSIWPETFSYTTQEIIMLNLPLIVFNIGAPAERVLEYEKGHILQEIDAKRVLAKIKEIAKTI